MSHSSSETVEVFDAQKEIRKHLKVLSAVLTLTLVNVGLSYAPIPSGLRIVLILLGAAVAGGLILAFFMHLISEGQVLVYTVSGCLAMGLVVLMISLGGFSVPEGTQHQKVIFANTHGHQEHVPVEGTTIESGKH